MSPFIIIIVLLIAEFVLSPQKKKRYQNADVVIISGAFCLLNALVLIITTFVAPTAITTVGWVMTAIQAVAIIGSKILVQIRNKKCKKLIPDEYTTGLRGKITDAFYQRSDFGPDLVVKFFAEFLGLGAYIAVVLIYVFFIIQNYYISTLTGGLLPPQTGTSLISFFFEFAVLLSGESLFKELLNRYNARKNCRSARELAAARYEYDDDYWRIFMDNYVNERPHIISATKQNYVDEAPKSGISFYDSKTKRNQMYEANYINVALEDFIKSNGLDVNPLYCAAFNLIQDNKNVLIKTPSYVDFEPYLAAIINQKIAQTEKIVFIVNSVEDQQNVKQTMSRIFKDYYGFDSVPLFKTIKEWHNEVSVKREAEAVVSDPFRHIGKSTEPEKIHTLEKNPDVVIASPDDICDPLYVDFIRAVIKRLGLIVYYNFNDCVQEEPLYAKIVHSLLDSEDTVSSLYMTDGFFDFEQALDNFFSSRTIYQISVPRKAPATSFDMVWKNENSQETQSREITDPSRNFGTHIGMIFYALGFIRNDAMLVADEQDAYSENMMNYTDDYVRNRIDHYVGWSNVMGGKNVLCTVSDTYNNIPHTYLSMRGIGTRSEYINIISRPYLLRNYLAHNLKFFSNEPRALSTFSSGIIRSKRALAIQAIVQGFVIGYKSEKIKILIQYFKLDEDLDEKSALQKIAEIAMDDEIEAEVFFDDESERYFIDEKSYTAILYNSNFIRKVYFHANGEEIVRPYRDYQYLIPHQKIVLNGTKYTVLSIDGNNIELTNSNNRDPVYASRIIRTCKADVKSSESYGKAYQHGTNSFIDFTHMVCDTQVDVIGCVSFTDKYSLLSDEVQYTFNKIDNVQSKNYKNTNIFKIRIGSDYINNSNKNELSHIMALLFNEMLPTFFPKHSGKIMIACSGWDTNQNLGDSAICPKHIVTPLDINDAEPAKDNEICMYIMEDSSVETGIINVFWQDEEFRYMLKILEDYLYHIEFVDIRERKAMFGRSYDKFLHTLRKTLLVVINDRPDSEPGEKRLCVNSIRRTRNKFYDFDLNKKYNLVCDFCGKPITHTPGVKNEYHYYHYSGRVSCKSCYINSVCSEKYGVLAIKELELGVRKWMSEKHKADICGEFYDYLEDALYINRDDRRAIVTDDHDLNFRTLGYAVPGDNYKHNLLYGLNEEAIGCNSIDNDPKADAYDIERTVHRLEDTHQRHILICDGYPRDGYMGCLCHELVHQWQFENLDFQKLVDGAPVGGCDEFGVPYKVSAFRYEGHAAWVEVNYLESMGHHKEANARKRMYLEIDDEYGVGYRWLNNLLKVGSVDPYVPKQRHTPEFLKQLRKLQMKKDVFGIMKLYFGLNGITVEAASDDETPVDEPSVDESSVDESSDDEFPIDEISVDESSDDEFPIDEISVDESSDDDEFPIDAISIDEISESSDDEGNDTSAF